MRFVLIQTLLLFFDWFTVISKYSIVIGYIVTLLWWTAGGVNNNNIILPEFIGLLFVY